MEEEQNEGRVLKLTEGRRFSNRSLEKKKYGEKSEQCCSTVEEEILSALKGGGDSV